MVLKRSDSARTTLSMYVTRTGKYQKWLGFINVVILMCSLCMMFMGVIFKAYYHMDKMWFISDYFLLLPWCLIGLGIGTFFVAGAGFITIAGEAKVPVMIYSAVMALFACGMVGIVFIAIETRTIIQPGLGGHFTVISGRVYYDQDPSFRADWDSMQQQLRCCGGSSYLDFKNKNNPAYQCVPKSCCINDKKCNVEEKNTCKKVEEIWDQIYIRGCMSIIEGMYLTEVHLQLLVLLVGGVALVFIEIVAVALSSAYVAQMTRRAKRWRVDDHIDNATLPMDNYRRNEATDSVLSQ